jgi:acetyl-CoA carboxylase, biotin carboxylase subunit
MALFDKILVANRGEIAVRVIRACREMGITSVAVFSDADRAALHVRKADEAYRIGAAPATESYLNIDRIIAVAKQAGADAVHPGYGFLSENPTFAQACTAAGLKFIGPTSQAMELMGSKVRARQAMQAAGIPFVPGSCRGLTLREAAQTAATIGYPVMLKAAAGGGGKGMRLVRSAEELPSAFERASSEAARAFGDDELYIEKLIDRSRHIEIQIMADEHGRCIHLGERECSVQRRHQKVVEESPSLIVDDVMRRSMGEVAVRVAQAAAYTNAGTVEFLVDSSRNFYFLEMNTRLQVEHPVTELVTGLDLVQLQIRIAAGEPLPITQDEVALRGHAIECRIYAEDPENNFFPSPGKISELSASAGPGIREDSGVYEGWEVPMDYDPLLSKVIAYAPTRETAIARLQRALDEYHLVGIRSNLSLFQRILRDPVFREGRLSTAYLDDLLARSSKPAMKNGDVAIAALAAAMFSATKPVNTNGARSGNSVPEAQLDMPSNWKRTARQQSLRNFP